MEELDLQLTDLDRQLEDVQARIQANQMDTQQTVEKVDARFKQVRPFWQAYILLYKVEGDV